MASIIPTSSLAPSFSEEMRPPTFWAQLLRNMHPSACFSAIDSNLPLDVAVPIILTDLEGSKKKREQAMENLYGLTDQKHRHFRVELVTKYKIVDTLARVLAKEPDDCRMALLTLNNLAIPLETKHTLLEHGPLLKQLFAVLREKPPAHTYLACLCLRNLSFDATHGQRLVSYPGDNLLELLQSVFASFAPQVLKSSNNSNMKKNLQSAEGLALQWSAGLLRQICMAMSPSLLNGYKELVRLILDLISHCAQYVPLHFWTLDSLPDACLVVILGLAKSDCSALRELDASQYLGPLIGKGGIHDTRASWIQCCLEGL